MNKSVGVLHDFHGIFQGLVLRDVKASQLTFMGFPVCLIHFGKRLASKNPIEWLGLCRENFKPTSVESTINIKDKPF